MQMRINKLLVTLAFSMLFSSGVAVASGDLDKGVNAYESGDFKTALAEWTPLAEQGDADAQYNLGYMYAVGEGVLENYRTSAKWFTLAAEQGLADAQVRLALMFAMGKGVLENNKTAYKWAKLAATQDHGDAQGFLGALAVVDEDYLRAYMWYSLAIYNGAEDISEAKDAVKALMTSADVDTAQQMASRCLESGYTDCWMMVD
jgi:TPR repeat protein